MSILYWQRPGNIMRFIWYWKTDSVPAGLLPVYENPKDQMDLTYLGEIEHARIFLIRDQ